MAKILDGRTLSRQLNKALKAREADLARPPGLAVVMVGENAASQVYVRRKGIVAERIGFRHRQIDLPASTTQEALLAEIDALNDDDEIDGILVQLPLPGGLDTEEVMDRIAVGKDVDGFTIASTGLLSQGRPNMVACTPKGVMKLIALSGIALSGARACVVGRSNIVGRPMAMLLEQANCTVTVCHSRTRDLADIVKRSDVVVAAVGVPKMIEGQWIKEGAVVIDVGMNRLDDGSLCGDVDYEVAAERAAAITPVPGGVGPMTIAMLMDNTFRSAELRQP